MIPKCGAVEALVAVFGRLTDLENADWRRWTGFESFAGSNKLVMWEEIEEMRAAGQTPYLHLQHRLGLLNLFNPLLPDGEYALNLGTYEERSVAQVIVMLSVEPGENMKFETFNGLPFEVGVGWLTAVPDGGFFCCQYSTPKGSASLPVRLALANQLLMPGRGRWKAIASDRLIPGQDVEAIDETGGAGPSLRDGGGGAGGEQQVDDYGPYVVDADGALCLAEAVHARQAGDNRPVDTARLVAAVVGRPAPAVAAAAAAAAAAAVAAAASVSMELLREEEAGNGDATGRLEKLGGLLGAKANWGKIKSHFRSRVALGAAIGALAIKVTDMVLCCDHCGFLVGIAATSTLPSPPPPPPPQIAHSLLCPILPASVWCARRPSPSWRVMGRRRGLVWPSQRALASRRNEEDGEDLIMSFFLRSEHAAPPSAWPARCQPQQYEILAMLGGHAE